MANEELKLDQHFREKLVNHEEKPSRLAWEKLDEKLNGKRKSNYLPVWGIAASIVLLIGVGYFFYHSVQLVEEQAPQLVILEEKAVQMEKETEKITTPIPEHLAEEIPTIKQQNQSSQPATQIKKEAISPKVNDTQTTATQLVAEAVPTVERNIGELPVQDLPVAELNLNQTLAYNEAEEEMAESGYRLTIKSKGLKDEPQKLGLFGEIENKVEKIGGLLNKVEQGFADLQDAKENLFAINTTRKERK
jgi:cytoskeletal protein RodZ